MPKLNNLQLADRLRKRTAELEAGVEIAAKDVRALLNNKQIEQLEAAWKNQQELRKRKRATTEEQQKELGWKTKRELRIEAFKQALSELEGNELEELKDLQYKKTVRQSRIYLDTYFSELDSGASKHQAEGRANNALTRAGLARLDGTVVDRVSRRDQQVLEMEERLNKQLHNQKNEQD